MSDFNWDDYEEEKPQGEFNWDDYEEDRESHSPVASAVAGVAQGVTFGLADEMAGMREGSFTGGLKQLANHLGADFDDEDIEAYRKARDESRKQFKQAENDNSGVYTAAEIGGGIASGLATGGLGATAKGASLGSKIAAGMKAGAVDGLVSGAGYSEGDDLLTDTVKGAGVGATIGGVLPGVVAGTKGTKKLLTKLVPGADGASDFVNKTTSKLASFIPASGNSDEIYEYLSSPTKRDLIRNLDVQKSISEIEPKLKKQIEKMDESVSDRFFSEEQNWIKKGDLVEDSNKLLESVGEEWETLVNKVDRYPEFYGPRAKKVTNNVQSILEGQSPSDVVNKVKAGEVDPNAVPRLNVLEARRYIDDFMKNKNYNTLSKYEREAIQETRDWLNRVLKEKFVAGEHRKEIDQLYSDFINVKNKALKNVEGVDGLSRDKLDKMTRNQTMKGKDFQTDLDSLSKFFVDNPKLKTPEVDDAIQSLKDLRELVDLKALENALKVSSGPTGQGANLISQVMIGLYSDGLSALALPVTNPIAWAKIVDEMSRIGGKNASKALQKIEKASPAIRTALIRQYVKNKSNNDN